MKPPDRKGRPLRSRFSGFQGRFLRRDGTREHYCYQRDIHISTEAMAGTEKEEGPCDCK